MTARLQLTLNFIKPKQIEGAIGPSFHERLDSIGREMRAVSQVDES